VVELEKLRQFILQLGNEKTKTSSEYVDLLKQMELMKQHHAQEIVDKYTTYNELKAID